MKRKKIIAGNWKMNGTLGSVRTLIADLLRGTAEIDDANLQWMVFPPYIFLPEAASLLDNTKIALGAQNLCQFDNGAYTGEISAPMLMEFKCSHVLVGHSERRNLFAENDETIAAKFITAIKAGLTPILCVGETLNDRESNSTKKIIKHQIETVIKAAKIFIENSLTGLAEIDSGRKYEKYMDVFKHAIIAYEPVWAIGTGINAAPEQAQEVHTFIRKIIAAHDPQVAENLQILYGGSLKPNNAKGLFAMPDIDGGLIGGASLKAEDFLNIGRAACNH